MAIFDRPSLDALPDRPDFEDVKNATGKGLISLVPVLGTSIGQLITSPLEERRNDWLRDLESRLRELEGQVKGFRFDNLGENPAFVTAVTQAAQAALRTHEDAKLDALRNAVLNVAAGTAPTADKQAIFLQMADRYTPLHLRLLEFFDDPQKLGATWANHTSVWQVIYTVFPDLADQFQLVNAVVVELKSAGLISPAIEHAMTPAPPYPKWATHLGEDFLRFIEQPDLSPSKRR
jgi:hypothetical protein